MSWDWAVYPDQRFMWVEVTTLDDPEPVYMVARCKHTETVPVESCVTGEILALVCLICDQQIGVGG